MKGWKTLAVSALLAAVGVLEQSDMIGIVPAGYEGIAITVVAGVMAVLRFATSSPVGKK